LNLSQVALAELNERLAGPGLLLPTGPYLFRINSRLRALAAALQLLYADFPCIKEDEVPDFHLGVQYVPGWQRLRRRVTLVSDGQPTGFVYRAPSALVALEWGMNARIWSRVGQHLVMHAATLERGGRGLIIPAPPGGGKSTLCAGLACSGWRLLSDELGLVQPGDGRLAAVARPICLKNDSLAVMKRFAPDACFGPLCHDTPKGTIGHMRPPAESVRRVHETAQPAWLVFVQYTPGAAAALEPLPKAQSFLRLARNSFNYSAAGERGFELLADLVDACDCFEFRYSDLREAVNVFDSLQPAQKSPATMAVG
jgi:hypothetical protein